MILDPRTLKITDRVRIGKTGRAAYITDITDNYIKLQWHARQANGDMVRKDSPLWHVLELVE